MKTAWDRHGVLVADGGKLSIHLDSILAGEWNGWLNLFERQEDQLGQGGNPQGHQPSRDQHFQNSQPLQPPQGFDDDIPF